MHAARALTLLCFLLASVAVYAEDYPFDASLYDARSLLLKLDVKGGLTLEGSGTGQRLEASVAYVPEGAGAILANPQPLSKQPLIFSWTDTPAGHYPFSYTTTVQSGIEHPIIKTAIPYPFESPDTVTDFLQPREITDTNAAIRAKSHELVNGQTDSLEAVFAIAQWVGQNVDYDLNTVTAQASQKSSWVYDNREGVCDEITSLFISLSREAGIPARFVSGIAYTNLDQFPDHWGPHGWAEVWLPDVGWVPVDVTYGQIGYVDATHIAIIHGPDAKTTAVDYSLLAKSLSMRAEELQVDASVLERSGTATEPVGVTVSPLYQKTGSESGNLITVTLANKAPYYVATEAYLATTADTTVLDNRRQQVLLHPNSVTRVSWRVLMPEFTKGFRYGVPFTVIAQRAGNDTALVEGLFDYPVYPSLDAPASEESDVAITCDTPTPLYLGERVEITCESKGSTVCAGKCVRDAVTIPFTAERPGAFPVTVTATRGKEKGSAVVTFIVLQRPSPTILITLPNTVDFDETVTTSFTIDSAPLTEVRVVASNKHLEHEWTLDALESKSFQLVFPATYLDAGESALTVVVTGKDKNGETVSSSAQATTTLKASPWERIELFFFHLFG